MKQQALAEEEAAMNQYKVFAQHSRRCAMLISVLILFLLFTVQVGIANSHKSIPGIATIVIRQHCGSVWTGRSSGGSGTAQECAR